MEAIVVRNRRLAMRPWNCGVERKRWMAVNELVVYDSEESCPYLPGMSARMPLRRPLTLLSHDDFDHCLASGDRRTGGFLYNTACDNCRACEPLRIPVDEFQPSRSQRRVWRKGEANLTAELGDAMVDEEHVGLFNRHRLQRGLAKRSSNIDSFSYEHFLVDSCCDTRELRYFDRTSQRLVAVAICDFGLSAVSAVYTYFDPDYRATSLGVYSVLKQIEWCRKASIRHLYLGYFVAGSPHMRYKSDYRPHERRIQGEWKRFEA